ncbi:MAG: acetoacetate decarboxylase family protein, partial [Gemmatimonadota bacterium]
MSYVLRPDRLYMMPTHFGPSCGPRQGPEGERFTAARPAKQVKYGVSFRTSREQLDELLPPGFQVEGDPIVTVEASYLTELAWLAGRGYNIVSVRFPALFQGKRDRASGPFLAVLWENLCDPILTGREQLGYSKLYADIPPPRVLGGRTTV